MDGRREEGNYRTRQQGEWDRKKRKETRKLKSLRRIARESGVNSERSEGAF